MFLTFRNTLKQSYQILIYLIMLIYYSRSAFFWKHIDCFACPSKTLSWSNTFLFECEFCPLFQR